MQPIHRFIITSIIVFCFSGVIRADEKVDRLIQQGRQAFQSQQFDKALTHFNQAIKADPKNVNAWWYQAQVHESLEKHAEAVNDYTKVLELDPTLHQALNERGSVYFQLGKINESVKDFDRYIKLVPKAFPSHWKRGISLYYAKRYEDGMKQFNAYESVDTNDVENAIWHFLCAAGKHGPKKAREMILKIGQDRRLIMPQVYKLFKGDIKPDDLFKPLERVRLTKEGRTHALFYGHLYLGLYYQSVEKDAKKALKHLKTATEHKIGHYMWNVADVAYKLQAKSE